MSLNLNDQINPTVKVASYNLRNIAFIRKYFDKNSTIMFIQFISWLDYFNSLYHKLPTYQLKMQIIMNKGCQVNKKNASPYDRITPVLIELYWLLIQAEKYVHHMCTNIESFRTAKPVYIRPGNAL